MGTVFNIQHFSIHDGPGIRTVVFLKGCPLRCAWCANPESQNSSPELGWTKGLCIGCGQCRKNLENLSCRFEGDRLYWDAHESFDPMEVRKVCPSEAFHVIGKEMTVEEVLEEVIKDQAFFAASSGGITLSGGEPLMQPAFSYDILNTAGKMGLHRAVETCGFVAWENFKKVASVLDYLIADVKFMDAEKHKIWTGSTNDIILDNLRKVRAEYPDLHIHIRTPVIPGVNDSVTDISEILGFVREIEADYELLRYHKLGQPKYESLNRIYPMGEADLDEKTFRKLEEYAQLKMLEDGKGRYYGEPGKAFEFAGDVR